jgi:hypothetical protein
MEVTFLFVGIMLQLLKKKSLCVSSNDNDDDGGDDIGDECLHISA